MPQKASRKRSKSLTRREQAVALRVQGLSYLEIGRRMSITKQTAHSLVTKGLQETARRMAEDAEDVRQIELDRLDLAIALVMERVKKKDLAAVERLVRLEERRAKLLGLDAPDKYEHAGVGGSTLAAPVILIPSKEGAEQAPVENADSKPEGSST